MSDEVRLSVRERAKLFEPIAVNVTPVRVNSSSSSFSNIGNNCNSDTPCHTNDNTVDFLSTPTHSPSRVTSQKPALPPKPHIDLKDLLLIIGSPENNKRCSISSYGSENLSQGGTLTSSTANSSTSERSGGQQANESCSSKIVDESSDVNQRIVKVVEELVSTEESYLGILDLLIDEFPKAMTGLLNGEPNLETVKGVLRVEDLKPIKSFHSDHLFPQFKDRLANWQSLPCISDIFVKSVSFFKMYASFVVNQETVVHEFDRLIEYYPDFKRAVDNFQCKVMSNPAYEAIKGRVAFRFTELFRTPFNRLFHYKNLLERYLKELVKQPPTVPNPDLEKAKEAISQMESVIRHLNEKMKEEAERKKFEERLKNLRNKLQNSEEFFKDKELKLIREGQLLKRSRKVDQIRYVVLFDTYIIIAKPHQIGNNFSIKYSFELQSAKVFVDEADPRNFVLSVPFPYSSSTFRTTSPKECDQWVQDFEDCRQRLVPGESNTVDQGNQPLCLPPWKPDHMFTNCTLCAKRFTTVNRKHHCRLCGLVYCESCSKQRWPISSNLIRVCDVCYAISTVDSCPDGNLPSGVLEKIGGSRKFWEHRSHQEKWYLYKDEFFLKNEDNNGSGGDKRDSFCANRFVPYLREVIAASVTCAKSGYLYVFDQKSSKFVSRWVVLEQDCLIVFEACQNTVALERHFLAGFRFEGPTPITSFPALKQAAENVNVKFVFTCFHENYNHLAESMTQALSSPNSTLKRRATVSNFSPSVFRNIFNNSNGSASSSSGTSSSSPLFLFGVEEDYIAEDWIKELNFIKRHSELVSAIVEKQ